MIKITLNLTESQARNLLSAVSKNDDGRPQFGDTYKSEDRKMLHAKVLVALEAAAEGEGSDGAANAKD